MLRRQTDERPVAALPRWIPALLAAAVFAQIAVRLAGPAPAASARELDTPPTLPYLRVLALGDPVGLSYGLGLRLQAFDNQPGISIPFADLDYSRVEAWLDAMLNLDPAGQYAMLMASHLYAQVYSRPDKARAMAEFVYRRFLEAPDTRWPWLAHMVIVAKHRLHDLPLAIRYADAIHDHASGPGVPSWARQMHIFLREDVGEVESARALLGGLLDSGQITDPNEFRFLADRLREMESVEKSTHMSKP